MRPSVMSRAAVAIAALGVASATLISPASAAASDINRDQVLSALLLVRNDPEASSGNPNATLPGTSRALRVLANRACSVDYDDEAVGFSFALPAEAGGSADGLLVLSYILDSSSAVPPVPTPTMSGRVCIFGALATADPAATLSGTATVTTSSAKSYQLSRNVFVTPGRSFSFNASDPTPPFDPRNLAFTAAGNATTSIKVTTHKTIKTPKTAAQKKAAKKQYSAALKSAKKSYDKALKKAGSSKSKKAAAKKAYDKKKAAAKSAYKKRIATSKVVKVTTIKKTPRPFNLRAMDVPTPP